MRTLCVIFFFILSFTAKGQTFFYSYVDPCSGKSKELTIPYGQNNVTVDYYGNVNTFNANDFNSGVFQSWVQNIAQTNTSNPCSGVAVIVVNNVNMAVTQNVVSTVMNITSLTASLSGLSSDIASITGGGGNMAAALDNSESGDSSSNDNDNNGGNTNGGSSTTSAGSGNNSQTQTNNGNSNGNSGSSSQTGGTSQQSNNTTSAGSTTSQPSVGSSSSNNAGTNGTTNTSTTGNSSTNNGSSSQSGNTSGGSTSNGASNNSGQSNGQTTGGSSNGSSVAPQSQSSGNTSTSTVPNSTSNGNINSNQQGTSTGSANPSNNTAGTETSNTESSSSGSGATSNALTNAEEGSSGGSSNKKDGGEKKSGSMIGQGDLVVMKSADDPAAKNQVKFNSSITKANTNNTRVKGILINYTSVVNNTNITLYKAWVFKKSKLTLIAANSSMMNFEKDFFNTTTTVLSKRYKGSWRKLTTMAGLNFTAGNYGNTPFLNASAVGGGFYAYKINESISGSLLVVGVYSPFTQFFDGKWWDSSILVVPYSTWDYKLSKTFKLNVSLSGVYEMNKSMLNYQVLTGGKIMF